MNYKTTRGFTLIELMIVLVVLATLTTMAVNSYQNTVRKTRRADAKSALLELAQLAERNYTETNTFAGFAMPFNQSPKDGNRKYYNIAYASPTTTTFTLSWLLPTMGAAVRVKVVVVGEA